MIEQLTADIEDYESSAGSLAKQIKTLDEDISTWEGDLKAATKVREIEAADYAGTHADYGESLTALEEGIAKLKEQAHVTPQSSAALAQLSRAPLIPPETKRMI